jgi:hypothetical protein
MTLPCFIYDYETLGVNPFTAPVLCVAAIEFDFDRLSSEYPYDYDEMVKSCAYMKFDVRDQIKNHGKVVETETAQFWQKQGAEAKKILKETPDDKPLSSLYDFFFGLTMSHVERVYTRGVKLEVVTTEFLMKEMGKTNPIEWWQMRETKSFIEGFTMGTDMSSSFIPSGLDEKFVIHDPRHDVVMDLMRMQTCVRSAME